jgi:hypothetical protein
MSKYSGKSDLYDLLHMHYGVIDDNGVVDLEKLSHWEIDAGRVRVSGTTYRDLLPYFGNIVASGSHQNGDNERHYVQLQVVPYFAERVSERANTAKELWQKARRGCSDLSKVKATVVKKLGIDPNDRFWRNILCTLEMSCRGHATFSPYVLLKCSKYDIHFNEWYKEMLDNGYTEHEIHGYLDADT